MQEIIHKADVLLEALPYIQRFRSSVFVVKYGGSALWATMVLLLVGALLPRLTRAQIAAIAAVIAIMVELSRLVHTPWLDAFRLTMAGALLLGRIFSLWNILAYVIGILFGAGLDRLIVSRIARSPHSAS